MHWLACDAFRFTPGIGDDWTDEDLFLARPDCAVTVKVGMTASHARYNHRDSASAIEWLSSLTTFHTSTTVVNEREVS